MCKFISTLDKLPEKGKEVLIKTRRGLVTNAIYDGEITQPDSPYPVFMRDNDGYGFTVAVLGIYWCELPDGGAVPDNLYKSIRNKL